MQGFNKYYPPDYDPNSGSLNKAQGKHALGDRARKLDKGILIVRFELPFNIWCEHCDGHIGQGVRYNAEKSKVGNYYTTPVWNFRCKCHLCQKWFEIRTDPQNTRYVVHSGARQQNQDWDPAENGGVVLDEAVASGSAAPDAFASLERSQVQKTRALSASAQLQALEEDRDVHWSDPYAVSSRLRSSFRRTKRVRLVSEAKANDVKTRYGLSDRVALEHLRTPARKEDRDEEQRQWGLAKEAQRQQRKQKEDSKPDSHRPVARSSTDVQAAEGGHDQARASSLRSKLLLSAASKRDPFGQEATANTVLGKRSRASLEGMLKRVIKHDK